MTAPCPRREPPGRGKLFTARKGDFRTRSPQIRGVSGRNVPPGPIYNVKNPVLRRQKRRTGFFCSVWKSQSAGRLKPDRNMSYKESVPRHQVRGINRDSSAAASIRGIAPRFSHASRTITFKVFASRTAAFCAIGCFCACAYTGRPIPRLPKAARPRRTPAGNTAGARRRTYPGRRRFDRFRLRFVPAPTGHGCRRPRKSPHECAPAQR